MSTPVAVAFVNQRGIGRVFGFGTRSFDRGGHQRIAQCLDDGQRDAVRRDPDADRLFAVEEFVGDFVRRTEQEGKGTRKIPFHQLERGRVYTRISGDAAQIVADESKNRRPAWPSACRMRSIARVLCSEQPKA